MRATGTDERMMVRERVGGNFLVYFYEGGDQAESSWSVDSYLLTDTDIPGALAWVRDTAPTNCCWSLGVVVSPAHPTTETELEIAWIIGADVLNMRPSDRTAIEEQVSQQMMARRENVDLP